MIYELFELFADASAITVNPSGSITDPNSWVSLTKEIGFSGLISIIVLCGVGFLLWKFGSAFLVLASKFYDELHVFLEDMKKMLSENASINKSQREYCQAIHSEGGPSNINDLRAAGHKFADAVQKIGDKVGCDVKNEVGDIHDALRNAKLIQI